MTSRVKANRSKEATQSEEEGDIRTDFEWVYTEEPHASRRKLILQAHPEIKTLFGHDPRSKWYALATLALQVVLALYCARPTTPMWQFYALGYIIGGTCSHSLTLAIHEMSHDLFFKQTIHNKLYSLFLNWGLVLPYAISFKKYHLEHHKSQGSDTLDVDIPTEFEGRFFTTPFRKFLWVLFQPAFYAIRPLIINPKPLGPMDILNIISQAFFLYFLHSIGGLKAILYIGFSTWMGLGMHPCAGHFIAEHYTGLWGNSRPTHTGMTPFIKGGKELYPDETFTYRGPLNMFSYNVGIHVAHHDFPNVSGLRLAEVEKMAPEFYAHLPETFSWPGTIWKFIVTPVNSFNRVKRKKVNLST